MSLFRQLNLLALLICMVLIPLGAWVRLNDAGLGCPDWPGCYGHLGVPSTTEHVEAANAAFPERPVEAHKGWKEMIHRYVAGGLGAVILAIFAIGFVNRKKNVPWRLPLMMLVWVLWQGLLGMLTVTWKVMPLIVTAHLLSGLMMFALIWWLWLSRKPAVRVKRKPMGLVGVSSMGIILLSLQIFLGGWTSTNYAALACTALPECSTGQMGPSEVKLGDAFALWHAQGQYQSYEYGVLDPAARQTIHVTHRLGAVIVGTYLFALGLLLLWRGGDPLWRTLGGWLIAMVTLQVGLGISAVHFSLPLAVATAHNAVAMLLLAVVLALNYHARTALKVR